MGLDAHVSERPSGIPGTSCSGQQHPCTRLASRIAEGYAGLFSIFPGGLQGVYCVQDSTPLDDIDSVKLIVPVYQILLCFQGGCICDTIFHLVRKICSPPNQIHHLLSFEQSQG